MSTESSQTQQNSHPHAPASAVSSALEAQLQRVESFYAQLADWELKALEQQKKAIDEAARMSREGVTWGANLAAEWRKSSLETTRRAMQMMSTTSAALPKMPFFG